jgi:hypothetical protein
MQRAVTLGDGDTASQVLEARVGIEPFIIRREL